MYDITITLNECFVFGAYLSATDPGKTISFIYFVLDNAAQSAAATNVTGTSQQNYCGSGLMPYQIHLFTDAVVAAHKSRFVLCIYLAILNFIKLPSQILHIFTIITF